MKNIFLGVLLLCLCGCASIVIPKYIHDNNSYKNLFYASFDEVKEATVQALEDSGWAIETESEPALFERERATDGSKQTLLFTKIRDMSFFVGSGHARLNAFVKAIADKEIEVEIRYVKVTSLSVKSFYDYKNDSLVEKLFKRIEENLSDVSP